MIQLYPKGQTDFGRNGIELAPQESEVNWQIAARYDFSMSIPREACEGITFDYGQILRVSVPPEHVDAISLGTVSYYETNKSTILYSQIPTIRRVSYKAWNYTVMGAQVNYTVGDKVTYDRQNFRCTSWDSSSMWVMAPPSESHPFWTQIPNTIGSAGKEIATLEAGTVVMKVRNFNSEYMEAATLTGYQGYIKIIDCDATGTSEDRTIPAFDITTQLFTINKIDKESDKHLIRIEAEHISYQLGRTMLGECNVVGVNPATALRFIQGAMMENYTGGLYSGIDEGAITADWSWKNAQAAILDPSTGLLKDLEARAIRNNRDVYIVPNPENNAAKYEVLYGVNMKSVKWTGDVSGIVTRVYPLAQQEDGSRLTLPEEYIDSVLNVPYIRPESLDTKLKVGQEIENSDGTKVTLTESDVLTRMRQAAQSRFNVDKCDQAEVTLDLDYVHMPDTEEYKAYTAMRRMAPGDWVKVNAGPMGVSSIIQLTEYVFDPIRLIYKRTRYGKRTQRPTVAGYNLKTGAVTNRALGQGAVRGENLQAGTITAREIEAGSITADQIASRIITAELIAAAAITANEIAAQAITVEKIAAQAITTDKLAANAVTAEKIGAGQINADHIAASAINAINAKLGTATISNGVIDNADIGFANIRAATAESLIAHDAVSDRYYIEKLQVRNVQAVNATVGELIVKAADNKYYRLDIDGSGVLTPTEVTTLTSEEIAAGVTSDGHSSIIETDLTVADLSASNMKAINALIDKISASRIDVDELFARSAFIGALNTTDISSNTYLQLMVNAKNKTYRQWETPSDPHDGDTWYKQAPQPISEMENYTHEQLSQYPYWAFNGYQLYRYEGITWRKVDDPAELRSTMSVLEMTTNSMKLGVAQLEGEMGTKYTVRSGIAIELAGIEISGSKYLRLKTGGKFVVDSGNFDIDENGNVTMNGRIIATSGQIGGYAIGATRLSSGSGTTFVALDSGTGDYAIWAGGDGAAYAPFRLKRDGTLTVTKLEILDEAGTGAEQINLRNYSLWKLHYNVIKSYTPNSLLLSNGETINFKTAADVNAVTATLAAVYGSPSGASATAPVKVTLSNGNEPVIGCDMGAYYANVRAEARQGYTQGTFTRSSWSGVVVRPSGSSSNVTLPTLYEKS